MYQPVYHVLTLIKYWYLHMKTLFLKCKENCVVKQSLLKFLQEKKLLTARKLPKLFPNVTFLLLKKRLET